MMDLLQIALGIIFLLILTILIESAFIIGTQIMDPIAQEQLRNIRNEKFRKAIIKRVDWALRAVKLISIVICLIAFAFFKLTYENIAVLAFAILLGTYVAGVFFGIPLIKSIREELNIEKPKLETYMARPRN